MANISVFEHLKSVIYHSDSPQCAVHLIHCLLFQHLADYASENLEAMNPPLFLRFLNLLMNDAIFLLDEAIQVRPGDMLENDVFKYNYNQVTVV